MQTVVGNSVIYTATPSGTYDSVTYQWYINTENTAGTGTPLGTENTYTYTPDTAGTYYISVVATYTYSTLTQAVTSTTATIEVQEANYSITSGDTTTYYNTLGTAVAGAAEGQTINVLNEVNDTSSITIDKNITLNIGANTITVGNGITVNSGITLALQGAGKITSGGANTIVNNGTISLSTGATIENTSSGVAITNTGTLSISNATISSSGTGVANSGTLTITGGSITGSAYGINNAGGSATIGSSTAELSTTSPVVAGGSYGMYKTGGSWSFNNGVLKGTTAGYNAEANTLREDHEVEVGTEGSYKTAYLKEKAASIPITDNYIGYYADIDDNGTVDGVIYADLAHAKSGEWGTNGWGGYSYSAVTSGLKEYKITGEHTESNSFGTKPVIAPVDKEDTRTDRFYVMALQDVNPGTYYCWYDAAYGKLDKTVEYSTNDFGAGRENTEYVMNKWTNSLWGTQNDNSSYDDMWGAIQTEVGEGWFVASKSEWAAFGGNLNITKSNYSNYGLQSYYWSSSQYSSSSAYTADVRQRLHQPQLRGQQLLCPPERDFLILSKIRNAKTRYVNNA